MTKKEKEKIFVQYLPLLKKQAYVFHKRTGIEQKELLSETFVAYCKSIDSYDGKKGSIGTFLYNVTKNHLINYCTRMQKKNVLMISFNLGDGISSIPDKEKEPDHFLDLFENHENKILRNIAEVIKKDIDVLQAKQQRAGWLDKFIHKSKGIAYKEIWKGFKLAETIIKGV